MSDVLWITKQARLYEQMGFTKEDAMRLANQHWHYQFENKELS